MAKVELVEREAVPWIVPLGDSAVLVRFASALSERANVRAIGFAQEVLTAQLTGVAEVVPSLVSVLVRYVPQVTGFATLAGELRLLLATLRDEAAEAATPVAISVQFGGSAGPDLEAVAQSLGLTVTDFILQHNARPLRVLATGFAPGFVYCGFHDEALTLPRRPVVRSRVEAGSILFAAGQTAIAATPIPTGWQVIGRTEFSNFDPAQTPPTQLQAGQSVRFEALP